MKTFLPSICLVSAALLAFAGSGCKPSNASEKPTTVSTDAKEKGTKSKARKREKKEDKAKGGKKPKPDAPAKPD